MKRVITTLKLNILVLLLCSCASAQNEQSVSESRAKAESNTTIEPTAPFNNFSGSTIKVKHTIIVKEGETFDGQGNLYEWVGIGDCSQTCLLYTSPSPRDLSTSRMPSSA